MVLEVDVLPNGDHVVRYRLPDYRTATVVMTGDHYRAADHQFVAALIGQLVPPADSPQYQAGVRTPVE